MCGSGTSFTQWLIPGDTLTDTGSANPGQSRIVTAVVSDTQLQIGQAFTSNIGSCSTSCSCTSTPDTLTYNGYFVSPLHDTHPSDGVEYPRWRRRCYIERWDKRSSLGAGRYDGQLRHPSCL